MKLKYFAPLQEKIRRQEREVKDAGSGVAVSTAVSNPSTSGRRRHKKKQDQSMVGPTLPYAAVHQLS